MIDSCPVADIHVHAQGTIVPATAWELGLRNEFLTVADGAWRDGPNAIGQSDPVNRYSRIFCNEEGGKVTLEAAGHPQSIAYNYHCLPLKDDIFSGFDAVMATVQGHRHPPGGIRTDDDYRFVMRRYLDDCIANHVRYTEALQNIHIAHVLHPELPPREARARFALLCESIVADFAGRGVVLRFHHCPNKTSKSNLPGALASRSLEWTEWLEEVRETAPNIFVALNSAGHEEQEKKDGGPYAMEQAYTAARAKGFGAEAHAGEGIGVEHMLATIRSLPVTRIAHGVQVIESEDAIREVRERGITLIMMPCINVTLGSPIHVKEDPAGDMPHAKLDAGGERDPSVVTKHITHLASHPLFPLLREHGLKIALATDNPGMGGRSYKEQAKLLAGIGYDFPAGFPPLSAEELALCNLNAIDAAFCRQEIKENFVRELSGWMKSNGVQVTHHLLNTATGPIKASL